MKEIYEFRIFEDKYHLLSTDKGIFNGSVYILDTVKTDPLYKKIGEIDQKLRKKYKTTLYSYWEIKRTYTKKDLNEAKLFQFDMRYFEPCGEECGTLYDETAACPFCGANRKQLNILQLKKGSIPKKKDIASTLGNEVIVSERFIETANKWGMTGFDFLPTNINAYYQLKINRKIELSSKTTVGVTPFDLSSNCEGEVYKCPHGDTLGLCQLSEAYVKNGTEITKNDLLESSQCIGYNVGVFRPRHLYFCSPKFQQMVISENLKGFKFEIAHIV